MKIINSRFPDDDDYYDCDYVLKQGKVINTVELDGTIYVDDREDLLIDNDYEAIKAFYDDKRFNELKDKGVFEELSTWNSDIETSNKRMNEALLAIKYRGGQGYYYGWWVLND